MLVGPDNGLLSLGVGALRAAWSRPWTSAARPHRLEPVSATFHGRDIFAPVAAHLAAGAELAEAGEHVEPDELQVLALPQPRDQRGEVVAHVLLVDRFGNVARRRAMPTWPAPGSRSAAPSRSRVGGERFVATFAQTFADVSPGDVILYEDAYRMLAIGVNRGDAAAALKLARTRRSRAAAAMIGPPRVHHRLTDSTNERAKACAAGAPHGTLVTADEQTAGRGRQGRTWTARQARRC